MAFRRLKTGNKYHARKITVDGMTFDSMKEYRRWCELDLLERAGEIHHLTRQEEYTLIPTQKINGRTERAIKYRADFCYVEKGGTKVVEDVKGYRGGSAYAIFRIKKKLMLYRYGITVKEV